MAFDWHMPCLKVWKVYLWGWKIISHGQMRFCPLPAPFCTAFHQPSSPLSLLTGLTPECATSWTKGQIHTSWRESGFEDLQEDLLLTVQRKELPCWRLSHNKEQETHQTVYCIWEQNQQSVSNLTQQQAIIFTKDVKFSSPHSHGQIYHIGRRSWEEPAPGCKCGVGKNAVAGVLGATH